MNPSSKGWLNTYWIYYKEHKRPIDLSISTENTIYDLVFSSSLLFSIPLEESHFLHPDFSKWNVKEKIKIVFAEHLFQISELYIRKYKSDLQLPDIYQKLLSDTQKNLNTEEFIDSIIDGKKDSLFLNAYNINPWLFLLLIEFYYRLEEDFIDVSQIQINIINAMYRTAQANEKISKNENRLLKRYIKNGNFSSENKAKLYKDIDITTLNTPSSGKEKLIVKVTYDLMLLALMTDSEIDASKLEFVNKYAKALNISLEEQHRTFSLIQNIHLNYYSQLPHLRKTYSFKSIKNVVAHNFKYILKKNSAMIINEIKESKELLILLRKSTDEKLSPEEKEKVREQALDLLKTIPSLTIFVIPGGSILLPMLIKILPEELLLPSSFINKNTEEN